MDASTLKHAADTVTERLSPMTETVAEKLAPVTETVVDKLGDLGDAAYRLAALTPWVEERREQHALRRWALRIAILATIGVLGWWWASRNRSGEDYDTEYDAAVAADQTGRRLAAAAGGH